MAADSRLRARCHAVLCPSRRCCSSALLMLLVAAWPRGSAGQHPCDAEVSSACPDRPAAELAQCLKDRSAHASPTELSSACQNFIALNAACSDDINDYCDSSFFTADTALCLSEWTDRQFLSAKCASVVKWAVPKKESRRSGPTDERVMSEKDYAEKQEWQAKRKAGRSAAIEKMRSDAKQEDELATMKREDPEGYKQLMKEREDAQRSYEELRKRKRLMAAAEERKRRAESGLTEEEEAEKAREEREAARMKSVRKNSGKDSWLPLALGGIIAAFFLSWVVNYFTREKDAEEDKDD